MAKMVNAKPKHSSGAYERVFNNAELGNLITKVQSTAISNGNELEKLILKLIKKESIIYDFDKFIEEYKRTFFTAGSAIKLIPKKVIKKSKKLKQNFEPDFIVLKADQEEECCYIIELKDGFTFDTKKVIGEKQHLKLFEGYIATQIPYSTKIRFCCFNENNKKVIKQGLKNTFEIEEIMTGREFCKLININYNKILEIRKNNGEENFEYFINELLRINKAKSMILSRLSLNNY